MRTDVVYRPAAGAGFRRNTLNLEEAGACGWAVNEETGTNRFTMNYPTLFLYFGLVVVLAPALLLAVVGLPSLMGRPLGERRLAGITQACVTVGLLGALVILGLMLASGHRRAVLDLGNWVLISREHFHFRVEFLFDRLSVPFVILTYVLVGTIGAFAARYMHREPGYHRFFLSYAIFLLGMIASSLAGSIETLFAGWELVGLASALLVAFFHDRPAPVRNGLHVWTVYRIADAAFLIAAVSMHHLTGEGDFTRLMGAVSWPDDRAALTSGQALGVGLLLLVAAAGKSALVPFSGWLPRAMEGPTPSSAVFYGALSVHLGAFLLLRVSPVLELSPVLCAAVVICGLSTALYASLAGRVQTDIKSALAFASLTQVGLIVAEIGFGLRYLALIHIIGHACLRTLQLLRAPTLIRDYHDLEDAIGTHLPDEAGFWNRTFPDRVRGWVFRFALERGYLDAWLTDYLVHPVLRVFRACDAAERRWTDLLSGRPSRESDLVPAAPESAEERP